MAFSLERAGDFQEEPMVAAAGETFDDLQPPTTPDLAAENAALKAENEALQKRLDDELSAIRAQLAGLSRTEDEVKPVSPGVPKLDLNKRYAKTRTSGGQVYFEQGGIKFNARGVMMTGPEPQG
jgi:hypothetical protein